MLALYVTIWLALLLFVAGETGRSVARRTRPPAWAWWAFTLGLVLALVHTALAFDVVHHWVHADAVLATARQTDAVFGVAVGWGVYVNYVFYGVWAADAAWWRRSPDLWMRPALVTTDPPRLLPAHHRQRCRHLRRRTAAHPRHPDGELAGTDLGFQLSPTACFTASTMSCRS